MKLSGLDFAKSTQSVFTAEVVCPWCERTASIDLGPQHRHGQVDYHCHKCGRFSSHNVRTADQWFDQHQEKLVKEKEVWKRIPVEAYVTCRRSASSGASFVYTVYLGKGSPTEYLSRDSAEHSLTSEFGMSWAQANAILTSAGLTPGQRIYLRQLTKISADLEKRQLTGNKPEIRSGTTVSVQGRKALFLRHSSEGFAIVAFPGIGDAEVPVVDLEVVDTGDTPAEVGFGDFAPENALEEQFEVSTTETLVQDLEHMKQHVEEVLEHERTEGTETDEISALEDAADSLDEATESLQDFVGEEQAEVDDFETSNKEDESDYSDNSDKDKTSKRRAAVPGAPNVQPNQDKLRALHNIINDPNTDPQTLQEAQRRLQQLQRGASRRKLAWWYKAPWEHEHMERPDHDSQVPDSKSVADESDLYPREGKEYPGKADTETKTEDYGSIQRDASEPGKYYHENTPVYTANRQVQQRVHALYNTSGNLKFAITAYRHSLSIVDIREILSFYSNVGKVAHHEADDLANWFIGSKPRLLSARQIKAVISGSPGSYHVKSESGKNLGGPYATRDDAKARLQQVEYFKHKDGEKKVLSKKQAGTRHALLDKGMGIFQPAMYRGRQVLVIAVDNTGNRATVQDGKKRQFQVDVADLTPTKKGPYTGKER